MQNIDSSTNIILNRLKNVLSQKKCIVAETETETEMKV